MHSASCNILLKSSQTLETKAPEPEANVHNALWISKWKASLTDQIALTLDNERKSRTSDKIGAARDVKLQNPNPIMKHFMSFVGYSW